MAESPQVVERSTVSRPRDAPARGPRAPADDRSRLPSAILVAVVLAGTLVRLARWIDARSLWLDEAMLALNVLGRTWRELLVPLDFAQAAPPGFLLLERAAITIGGPGERALRFLPLVAGILVPVVAWRLARGLLRARALVLLVTLCAWSPLLLRYSDDPKQYSGEVLVALLLALATRHVVESPAATGPWLALGVIAMLAPLLATSAFLLLPAVALALLTSPDVRAVVRRHRAQAAIGAALVAIPAVVSFRIQSVAYRVAYLRDFWESAFLRPGAADLPDRAWAAAQGILNGFLVGSLDASRWGAWVPSALALQALFVLALLVLGAWRLARDEGARERRWLLVLAVVPIVLAIVASALGRYPLSGRQLLFAAPMVFLLCVAGVEQVVALLPRRLSTLAWACAAAGFVLPAATRLAMEAASPIRRQHVRPLIERLAAERRRDEPVYISAIAIPAWTYYTTDWRAPDRGRLRWILDRTGPDGPLFHSQRPLGARVVGFGDELRLRSDTLVEIFGLPTGRVVRWGGFADPLPDAGWAENESRRITDAARAAGSAWVLYVPLAEVDREPAFGDLRRSLESRGWTLAARRSEREAELMHWRMGRPATP